MTQPTIDVTDSMVFTAVRSFLLAVLPVGVPVVQGQQNMVAEPGAPDFVVMWPLERRRLAYNVDTWNPADVAPTAINREVDTQIGVQLDVHGPNSSNNAQLITTTWQDDFGADFFKVAGFSGSPLYAEDPQQIPFLNAASQWETRWVIKAALQADITVMTPAEFANTLTVDSISVQATYPVE